MQEDLTAECMAELFDITSDAIVIIDGQQTIIRVNRAAEKLFGYAASEMRGMPLDGMLPEHFVQTHQPSMQGHGFGIDLMDVPAPEMSLPRAVFGRRKDGSEFPAMADISRLTTGLHMSAVLLRDATEGQRSEAVARAESTLAATATERSRLARELHDAVTQSLFSASLMAEVLPRLWEQDRAKGLTQLQDIRMLTRGALAEMRILLLDLRPTAIVDCRLSELVTQLAEATTCRSGIKVAVSAEETTHLPAAVHMAFYRIAQEALHNISKHSGAATASVQISMLQTSALMLIHDDGRGFEYAGVGATHLGLRIMQERAGASGACVQIDSGRGQGTDVLVSWSAAQAA